MSIKSTPNSFRVVAKSIDMVDGVSTTDFPINAGSITIPILTDNGDGTATISASSGYIYNTSNYSDTLLFGTVAEQTFTFTDGSEEYVVVDYNNGNPVMRKETNKFLINGSNIIALFICWRQGNVIHSINQGAYGLGLANKINRVMYNTVSYLRSVDGGLILSITNTPVARTVTVSDAVVYAGSTAIVVGAFNSSTDLLTEAINNNGVWLYTNVSVYDNISYNPILTGKQEAGKNKYITRWFYRSIGDAKQVFYVMGNNYYNSIASAETELQPSLPILLRNHCMLIGKIIIKKSLDTYSLYSAFDTTFIGSEVVHNDTTGLQGGVVNEYYHLEANDYNNLTGLTPIFPSLTIGDVSNNTRFDVTGHQTMVGASRPWRDALGELLAKKRVGARITEDLSEGTIIFAANCQIADDYVITNVQLNHDRVLQGAVHPHLHFFQNQNNIPNWMIQYRWHENGAAKTTSWTPAKWSSIATTYTSGTILQIAEFGTINPPSNSNVSPIIQFRILRDTDNDSTLFTGVDPYTGPAHALMFDVHLQIDSLGSTDEYVK